MDQALTGIRILDSSLSRLDARWKLAAITPAALAIAAISSLPAGLLGLAFSLILVVWARLPVRWYLSRLAGVGLFLVTFVVLLPFLLHDPAQSGQGGFALVPSMYGLRIAVGLCVKALAVVSLMLVLLGTTPMPSVLKAAHRLRVPAIVIQLAVLTHRYIYLLGEELSRLRIALRIRGYRNRASRHCYKTVGNVAGILLVRGQERAETVGQAMRCRGFDGRFRALDEFKTNMCDVVFLVAMWSVTIALLCCNWMMF